jgi:hypothetical protein
MGDGWVLTVGHCWYGTVGTKLTNGHFVEAAGLIGHNSERMIQKWHSTVQAHEVRLNTQTCTLI